MLDLKLLILLFLALFWLSSVMLTFYPQRLLSIIQETLNDPERVFLLGIFHVFFAICILYSSLYYFPNLTLAEMLLSACGIFIGAKGFYHMFWPKRIADFIKNILQTRLVLLRNISIIMALIYLFVLTTL